MASGVTAAAEGLPEPMDLRSQPMVGFEGHDLLCPWVHHIMYYNQLSAEKVIA